MRNVERLCLAHFWVAFGAFLVACILGAWQMWVRSPLGANIGTPGQYFMSVTAHGVSMAYVLTTFFIMGFGYFVAVTSLNRPLPGKGWAWAAFWIAIVGVVMAVIPILMGKASVLFTFYPPLTASPWFYIGLVLVVAGSWIWCVLMLVAMRDWKRENPGTPGAPCDVCYGGECDAVAMDYGWRSGGASISGHSCVARPGANDRRRSRPHAILVDTPRYRLFLAHTGLHRVLHDGAARGRRTTL